MTDPGDERSAEEILAEALSRPRRAHIGDLVRPQRLYAGIDAHPNFVVPLFLLVACVMVFSQTAVGTALPRLVPVLLQSSQATESELVRAYRLFVLVLSFLLPGLVVAVLATASWLIVRPSRARPPFPLVVSLVAHASLWAGIGFLAKAALVPITGSAEPALNLGLFLRPHGPVEKILFAFTNPFALLALVWTARGLRSWGVGPALAWVGGGLPWAACLALLAVGAGGTSRFAPSAPVSTEDWRTIPGEHVELRHAPESRAVADEIATVLDGFATQIGERFGFDPHPIRVNLYRDHADLERATGEFLHVRVTGSIRGRDLLYLETPGRSAALPREAGLRDALRYVALVELAPVAGGAPRWFVEGVAHASTTPYSPDLEREFRRAVRAAGVPTYEALLDPALYRTPEGPLLARSVVDFIAYHHGKHALEDMMRDVIGGTSFRDALYARTRLTTSALEAGWQDTIAAVLRGGAVGDAPAAGDSAGTGAGAAEESAAEVEGEGGSGDIEPFRERR